MISSIATNNGSNAWEIKHSGNTNVYNNHYKIQYGDIETEYTVTYDKVISLFNQSFLYKNII
jgi:hypothetical protein